MAQWWNKDSRRGTSVVVKMENPNFSMVELESPEAESDMNDMTERSAPIKGTGRKNAKQMTWVLLLKAHKAAGCLASLAAGAVSVGAALRRRLTFRAVLGALNVSGRLTKVIRGFLIFSLVLLGFELLAYFRGWDFARPSLDFVPAFGVSDLVEWIYSSWIAFRVAYLAPPLQMLSDFCVVLFLIQSVDRMVLCLGCFWIKWNRIKAIPKSELVGVDGPASDLERGAEEEYPKVLIQMPMCNEREVYQQSIAAICGIDWPKDRMLVQVLDDSDDAEVRMLIEAEVQRWQQKGIHIVYRHRVVRTGYKAGNLKSAMNCDYVKDYEFVAIFDADFQPKSDFLKKTVPHFKGNDDLALVQARWSFINKDENLLTRLQNINLCFHFEVEQQVNAAYIHFFGFNGTAGVWRIKALEESGGWLERTTVEDMDIAVRAHLHGWKFVFLNDVTCLCELPESYEAYRKQQHRWHSGPMQLFRLSLPDVIRSEIGVGKKANLIFLFFLLRKLVLPFYSFTLFCIILPMTMFIPEAQLPSWVVCYIPAIMSIMNILPSPKSFPFIVPYLLFENTMSVTKFNAMVSGLFQLGSAYEWIVTKKSGRSSEADLLSLVEKESHPMNRKKHHRGASDSDLDALSKLNDQKSQPPAKKKKNRIYKKELSLALLLLTAAARSLISAQGIHFYFLLFQGITFLVVGLDLIGEQVS